MWIDVDNKEVLNLHQLNNVNYPQINSPNSNRTLNK